MWSAPHTSSCYLTWQKVCGSWGVWLAVSWMMVKSKASHGILADKCEMIPRLCVKLCVPSVTAARNGPYSKCFGRWAGMSPDEVREQVLEDLEPLRGQKGVKDLLQKLACGSSGEAMVLINACKCVHVVKNWCFETRSTLATLHLLSSMPAYKLFCFSVLQLRGNWWKDEIPDWLPKVLLVLDWKCYLIVSRVQAPAVFLQE